MRNNKERNMKKKKPTTMVNPEKYKMKFSLKRCKHSTAQQQLYRRGVNIVLISE